MCLYFLGLSARYPRPPRPVIDKRTNAPVSPSHSLCHSWLFDTRGSEYTSLCSSNLSLSCRLSTTARSLSSVLCLKLFHTTGLIPQKGRQNCQVVMSVQSVILEPGAKRFVVHECELSACQALDISPSILAKNMKQKNDVCCREHQAK